MCGIFGAVASKASSNVLELGFFGLSQLQHRGQESAGFAYSDGKSVWIEKGEGLISHVLTNEKVSEALGRAPIMIVGQTRYSTSKGTSSRNIQPQYIDNPFMGRMAIIHNGNIPDLENKKAELAKNNIDISPEANDTEFMLKKIYFLMEDNGRDIVKAIGSFMESTPGSYSAAILYKRGVYLFRDPWGNRPLFISSKDGVRLFASETCALEDYSSRITQIDPGGIVSLCPYEDPGFVNVKGYSYTPLQMYKKSTNAHCVFEKIYFARPDSQTFGDEQEGSFRFRLGQKLAKLYPVPNSDFVSGIPESGRPAATGFAFESRLPILDIYTRNPFILGRTFTNPNPGDRASYSKKKYHLMKWVLKYAKNKSVVLVDDSIVRGNTLKGKVAQLLNAGAKEVHLRISAPPIINPCFYGIDLPTSKELIASGKSEEEVREWLGATSLKYLPISALEEVIKEGGQDTKDFCTACFTGNYPIPLD